MKPAAFEYVRAGTVTEALDALDDPEARVLAGGQSLVPLMNLRLAVPGRLVDVNDLTELDAVQPDDDELVLGALCRHRRVEVDPTVREHAPLLAEAAGLVGHPAIRNRGTLGGSLAHGDPSAELAAALVALDGRVRARGSDGSRDIAASQLYLGFFTTSLQPGELLVEVVVPKRGEREGSAFVEFAPRRGDFAVVGVAARIVLDSAGRCTSARAAGCGLADTPIDLSAALEPLVGEAAARDTRLRDVASQIPALFEPGPDLHASANDRRELAQILTVEAVRRSWTRAGGPR